MHVIASQAVGVTKQSRITTKAVKAIPSRAAGNAERIRIKREAAVPLNAAIFNTKLTFRNAQGGQSYTKENVEKYYSYWQPSM